MNVFTQKCLLFITCTKAVTSVHQGTPVICCSYNLHYWHTSKSIPDLCHQPLYLEMGKYHFSLWLCAYTKAVISTIPKIPTGISFSSCSMMSNTGRPLLKSAAIVFVFTGNFDSANNTMKSAEMQCILICKIFRMCITSWMQY